MPLPHPRGGKKNPESRKAFISRCAANPVMNKEYPDNSQRVAVCFSLWRESKKKKTSKGAIAIEVGDEEYIFDNDESIKDDSETPTS